MKIKAKTHFVWTEKAALNSDRTAGEPVGEPYKFEAPEEMVSNGYIIDSTDYTGQTDLFSALEDRTQKAK